MYAAEQLIQILAGLRHPDPLIQDDLDALRFAMARQWRAGTPWRARESLDVILTLDQPAWATLLGLIDECPTLHAAISATAPAHARTVSASGFEFISENRQIASVRGFFQSLPDVLQD